MEKDNYLNKIKELLGKSRGSLIKNIIDGNYPELEKFIKDNTSFMDKYESEMNYKYSWLERIYCILNNLQDFPKCKAETCKEKISKPSGFLGLKRGFRPYCCNSCATHSPEIIQHREDSCLKKYGVKNTSKLETTVQKMLKTRDVKKSTEIAIKKARETRFLKNNGKWHAKNFGDKVKSGKISNGHDSNWNNLEKRKETLQNKYGVKNTFSLPNVHKKASLAIQKKSFENFIEKCQYDSPLFTFEEYAARKNDSATFSFKCKKCGLIFSSAHHDGKHRKCPKCFPKLDGISNMEIELRDFISSYVGQNQILFSTRAIIHPLEIDVYIPSKNLAFEFDGLYWHCNENKEKEYHVNKTKLCEEKGIQLIHIFENEWVYKQDIVKSRLRNLFGIYEKKVYARQCEIRDVPIKISKQFQDENHIQGSIGASVHLGLYYENELISLMTFGKCRFDKNHEWELLRFCNKLGYHIPGSASKLLNYFEKNYKPKNLVSYADRRWSIGNVYKKLGFKFLHNSNPNYWYFKKNSLLLESRVKYQKHKLEKMLEKFDNNKTEVENMKENGYYRIFDCGNMVFEKNY